MRVHRPVLAALTGLGVALAAFFALPVVTPTAPYGTLLLDRDGRPLDARIAADTQWRFAPTAVPPRFAAALVHAEDRRFWSHPGVDPVAVARALWSNVAAGRVVSGASTLTMQVQRIAGGSPPRTLQAKVWESLLALRLEASASKDDVLAMYAAHAPMGGNTVGLDAAAWRHFGRPPTDLTWAQAATLAVLPNSPGLIHPGRNRDALRDRRDALLHALHGDGQLDGPTLQLALAEPLPGPPRRFAHLAPHLLDAAGPGTHPTTLDGAVQRQALDIVWRHHERLAQNGIADLGALIVDLPTGEVRAYVGNVTDRHTGAQGHHVDVIQAPRSTGSTLKPFLYERLLEDGALLPTQLVPDLPLRFGGFAPQNYDLAYEGAVPAHRALARSRNVPAVWMLRDLGVDAFAAHLRRLGLTTLHRDAEDYGLSLILGGAEGTLWELTEAYRLLGLSALEVDGTRAHWRVVGAPDAMPPRLDPAASWWTLHALEDVHRPGEHAGWRDLRSSRRMAWKTGTSMGFRDAWALGVTPQTAIGVWAGNASGEGRAELVGTKAAAPVLFELIDLTPRGAWFDPPHLVPTDVCADSGMRAGPDCPHVTSLDLPPASLRATACTHCERIHCDADCTARVHADCAVGEPMRAEPWFVLPADQEARYTRVHAGYRPLPPWREDCAPADAVNPLAVVYPRPGAVVRVPTDLDGKRGRVVLEASHRDADAQLTWHLDGTPLATTRDVHQLQVDPSPGEHALVVVDQSGARRGVRFEVVR